MSRELLPTASSARTWAVVRALAGERRGLVAVTTVTLVASAVAALIPAALLGRVVDLVRGGAGFSALFVPVGGIAVAGVAQAVAGAVGAWLLARLGESMLAQLRERFVERALDLPLDRLEAAGVGDLSSRVSRDVSEVASAVRNALPTLARSVLVIGLTLGALVLLDWRFLPAALVAVPVQWYTVRWYGRRAGPLYSAARVADAAVQQQLLDSVGGAATVRAFRIEDDHLRRVDDASRESVRRTLVGVRLLSSLYNRLNLAEYFGLAAVLVVGFLLVRAGSCTIGTAAAAALYVHALFHPVGVALTLADDAQSATASLSRLVGVSDAAAHRSALDTPLERTVKLADVHFGYRPGVDVVHGVSLEVAAGERVALVGASGAGKTSLAKVIAGVHPATSGTVLVGGVAIGDLGADAARTVALVTQETHVFAGTLADDLRLARPEATDDQLLSALELVGAAGWVAALPEGPATVVGEGGHELTAARAQQIALARVALADPPIVVLDEATADAGSAGARELERAADAVLRGRTALIVAHRLTQVAGADRVIVLDQGRIVEEGRHDELISLGGRYADLWSAWTTHRPAVTATS